MKGELDSDELVELVDEITKEVERLVQAGEAESVHPDYRIRHDPTGSEEKTVALAYGKYRYEETLAHLVRTRLKEKEEQIRKGQGKERRMKSVVAFDTRSLLGFPIEPENDYEGQVVERNRPHFERLRMYRQQFVSACQDFVRDSSLVKGVLLWGRRRLKSQADKVHRRYAICLVTPTQALEVGQHNLSAELSRIVHE